MSTRKSKKTAPHTQHHIDASNAAAAIATPRQNTRSKKAMAVVQKKPATALRPGASKRVLFHETHAGSSGTAASAADGASKRQRTSSSSSSSSNSGSSSSSSSASLHCFEHDGRHHTYPKSDSQDTFTTDASSASSLENLSEVDLLRALKAKLSGRTLSLELVTAAVRSSAARTATDSASGGVFTVIDVLVDTMADNTAENRSAVITHLVTLCGDGHIVPVGGLRDAFQLRNKSRLQPHVILAAVRRDRDESYYTVKSEGDSSEWRLTCTTGAYGRGTNVPTIQLRQFVKRANDTWIATRNGAVLDEHSVAILELFIGGGLEFKPKQNNPDIMNNLARRLKYDHKCYSSSSNGSDEYM